MKPAAKPNTQPGDKHDLRFVNRPYRLIKPPYYHHRSYPYHRPPYSVRPPRYHLPFIYVRPGYWYPPYRGRYYYYHSDLVGIATITVFAGVTYAIVHDSCYRRDGVRYVYVRYPPSGNYTIFRDDRIGTSSAVNEASASKQTVAPSIRSNIARIHQKTPAPKTEPSPYKLGEIVDSLPHTKETMIVDGQSYFKYKNTWSAPLRAERKFVVVKSPL